MTSTMSLTELEQPAPQRRRKPRPLTSYERYALLSDDEKRLSKAVADAIVQTLREVRAAHEAAKAAEAMRRTVVGETPG